jgi:DNA topoisomerase-1
MCLNPDCPTKKGPEIMVGKCPSCGGELKVMYSQVGSRYVRCGNYDAKTHPVSYPLPQSGEIEATDETCEPCGAPKIVVHTRKGPWKICIDPECPAKPPRGARPAPRRQAGARGKSAKGRGKKGIAGS